MLERTQRGRFLWYCAECFQFLGHLDEHTEPRDDGECRVLSEQEVVQLESAPGKIKGTLWWEWLEEQREIHGEGWNPTVLVRDTFGGEGYEQCTAPGWYRGSRLCVEMPRRHSRLVPFERLDAYTRGMLERQQERGRLVMIAQRERAKRRLSAKWLARFEVGA
jgi:hypothetical protein